MVQLLILASIEIKLNSLIYLIQMCNYVVKCLKDYDYIPHLLFLFKYKHINGLHWTITLQIRTLHLK